MLTVHLPLCYMELSYILLLCHRSGTGTQRENLPFAQGHTALGVETESQARMPHFIQ